MNPRRRLAAAVAALSIGGAGLAISLGASPASAGPCGPLDWCIPAPNPEPAPAPCKAGCHYPTTTPTTVTTTVPETEGEGVRGLGR
jgi:hypothetical protein